MVNAELMNMVCEIMAALAMLMQALAMAGMSSCRRALDEHGHGQVRDGLHEVLHMVKKVTDHLKGLTGQDLRPSGSQGTLPAQVATAPMASGTTGPRPMDSPIVFMTKSNFTGKGGKYHYAMDCHSLANALSPIEPHDLETLLKVPRHKFELCLTCQSKAN